MNSILTARNPPSLPEMGGKAAALARMAAAGLPVPGWFVVSPRAFRVCLAPEALTRLAEGDSELTARILAELQPGGDLRAEVARALGELCPNGEPVAVRSSAIDEDGQDHSFAGQLTSYLFVPADEVMDRIVAVWRSGFSDRILAYRREMGLFAAPEPPAVLVQRMVDASVSGVAFSSDPVSGRRTVAVVSAVFGLGTALVSGECDADTWRVDRTGTVIEKTIAQKKTMHVAAPGEGEGVRTVAVDDRRAGAPCLTDRQLQEVAALARRAAHHFGRPQDIEWALEGESLHLLQSRPITGLAALPDPDGGLNIWDNSNIAESYGGVTTPLTFSFASHIYAEVYRQFCRIMAVPGRAVRASEQVFPRMLGMVRGRVYYNLLNWYRLLALFPGFTLNRQFMEQMMGVKEKIPDEVLAEALATYRVGRFRDGMNLVRTVAGLLVNLYRLPKTIERFYRRLDRALAPHQPPLDRLRPDELAGHYRMLESQLLTRWDAPLINDFFAMVFYGLMQKLVAGWCGDAHGLQNDLISGEGGMISAEPAKRVREMAEAAAGDEKLTETLCSGDILAINRGLAEHGRLRTLVDRYLERFGDRCLDELKLESATLHDDPLLLYRSVGEYAGSLRGGRHRQAVDEGEIRRRAEGRAAEQLAGHPFRRLLFKWVLAQARARVRDRENLRFERTRLFGRVRRIYVELGRRFAAEGILDDPRDIFWLEKNEIFGFIEGIATTTDLHRLAGLRREEFARWRDLEPPADRFETRGMVSHAQPCRAAAPAAPAVRDGGAQGIGCCPGVVRGRVRVIRDPRGAVLRQGEILVAERTDPGWIMLFPAAAGLLVERGSLLSHSAIVAREMGLPAVVSLAGVTGWLRDGDLVEMDGARGTVRKLEECDAADQ